MDVSAEEYACKIIELTLTTGLTIDRPHLHKRPFPQGGPGSRNAGDDDGNATCVAFM